MPSWKKVITSGSDACLNSISVDSTTVVTNLNADKVDGCDASAFYSATNPSGFTDCTGTVTGTGVANNIAYWTSAGEIAADEGCLYWDPSSNELGIGTSTPGAPLDIYRNDTSVGPSLRIEQDGSGDALMQFTLTGANLWNVGIDNSNGDALTFARGTFSTGLETLVLKSTNVGIGNTNPPEALTVEGNISSSGDLTIDGDSTIDGNLTVGGTLTAQEFKTELVSASIIYQSGSTKFGDTSDDIHSFSGSLRVTGSGNHYFTNGNVGIGTASPSQTLTVEGNISGSGLIYAPNIGAGVDNSVVVLDSDGTLRTDEIDSRVWGSTLVDSTGTPTAGHIPYFTDSNTITMDSGQLYWDSSNNRLGIGTNSPSQALTVAGNISGSGTLVIDGNTTLGNATSDLHIFNGDIISNISAVPTLAAAGRVLNIDGNGGGAFGMFTSNGSSAGWLSFFGGGGATMYYKSGTSFCIGTSTAPGGGGFSEKVRFDGSGNLGIGINAPSATLHVAGGMKHQDGNVTFNDVGGNYDFRVESDTNANMLFVDGGTDRVGIGTNAPEQIFHVDGGVNNAWGIFKKSSGTTGHLGFYGGGNQSVLYALRGGTFEFGTSTASSGTGYKAIFEVDANDNLVVNQDGDSAIDFRVESDTNTHMLFVDAGTNRVGIGTNSTSETLTVKGNTEISGSIISPNFSAGLLGGDGYKLSLSDTVGCTALEVDNLLVRGRLSVVEFLAQQIRATNGTLFVTSTGKVETVTTSGPPYTACITTPTGSNHGFAVGDRIRAQRFDGFGNVYKSDLSVTAVPNPFAFTASYQEAASEPQPGFEYVRLGNSGDTDRQGGIILTSDLDDSPYIKIYDGVEEQDDIFDDSKTKVLVGNLSSHNSTTFGCLSGSGGSPNYGFYASGSAYLEGSINATGGEIGGITICNTSISASNGGFEIKSDGSATFASGQITFESDGDITSNEYLIERSRVFGDGSDGCYTVNTGFSSVAGLFNVTGTGFVTACLLRDAYFCNLTITGTSGCFVYIKTNGYRMFVKDTLTVCSYGFIEHNGSTGGNGVNAADDIAGAGGSGGIGAADGNILGGTNGGAGGYGGESP